MLNISVRPNTFTCKLHHRCFQNLNSLTTRGDNIQSASGRHPVRPSEPTSRRTARSRLRSFVDRGNPPTTNCVFLRIPFGFLVFSIRLRAKRRLRRPRERDGIIRYCSRGKIRSRFFFFFRRFALNTDAFRGRFYTADVAVLFRITCAYILSYYIVRLNILRRVRTSFCSFSTKSEKCRKICPHGAHACKHRLSCTDDKGEMIVCVGSVHYNESFCDPNNGGRLTEKRTNSDLLGTKKYIIWFAFKRYYRVQTLNVRKLLAQNRVDSFHDE